MADNIDTIELEMLNFSKIKYSSRSCNIMCTLILKRFFSL